jgi:putative oxidoreductase
MRPRAAVDSCKSLSGKGAKIVSLGERLAPVFGRGLLALIFLLAGYLKMTGWDGTVAMLAAHKLPGPAFLLAVALLTELLCGAAILVGFRTKLAALLLFLYTLTVNYVMHDFWSYAEPAQMARYAHELQLFVKNMAIAGGLLLLVGHGAGEWSWDSWRGEN